MYCDIGAADIIRDTPGTIGESGVAQVGDQGGDGVVVQGTGFDTATDRKGHDQYGTAEWIFLRARCGTRGQFQEFLGDRPGTIEGSVWHVGILRLIVRCSKKEDSLPHGETPRSATEKEFMRFTRSAIG